MELYYLYVTINEIDSKVLTNTNKILLMVDPWYTSEKNVEYGIKVFNWKYDETLKTMGYSELKYELFDYKVSGSSLHSDILSKEEFLLNLNATKTLNSSSIKEIIEELKKSVNEEMKISTISKSNTIDGFNTNNLLNLKKQMLISERFLAVIENYLNGLNNDKLDTEILHQIDYITHTISTYLDSKEVAELVEKDLKNNQIIDSLTNLLNVQVRITEKINKLNI
jgi:hypothetical protein